MAWGRLTRYCCGNTAGGCTYALADSLFTPARYRAWAGRCQGTAHEPGCGRDLMPGRPEDRRLRYVTSSVVAVAMLAGAAAALRAYVFLPPMAGIAFAADQSRIDDSAGQIVLEIRRASDLQAPAQVRIRFVDGSAKADADYQIPGPSVDFQPGQGQAKVPIPILPDTTLRKRERHFSVVLDNVAGQPRHMVVIAPRPIDATAQVQVEQMVLNASRIAADMAGYVVKAETMEHLLQELRDHKPEFQEFRRQMRDATENLVRAREAYLQAVRVLQTQPPQQVLAAIDRLQADLNERGIRQQSRVLPVLGRQYRELVQGKAADMDRWVQELGQTIERVSPASRKT